MKAPEMPIATLFWNRVCVLSLMLCFYTVWLERQWGRLSVNEGRWWNTKTLAHDYVYGRCETAALAVKRFGCAMKAIS